MKSNVRYPLYREVRTQAEIKREEEVVKAMALAAGAVLAVAFLVAMARPPIEVPEES